MARATYALVKIRTAGKDPANHDETSIGNMCDHADHLLDNWTAPSTLSSTSNAAKAIAVSIVIQLMAVADWFHSDQSTPKPDIFTPEIVKMIEAAKMDTAKDAFWTVPAIED